MKHVAVALLMAWPLVGLAVGPDSDNRITGEASRLSPPPHAADTALQADTTTTDAVRNVGLRRADAAELAGWSDRVYRYGQREPEIEELPMKGRAPVIGAATDR